MFEFHLEFPVLSFSFFSIFAQTSIPTFLQSPHIPKPPNDQSLTFLMNRHKTEGTRFPRVIQISRQTPNGQRSLLITTIFNRRTIKPHKPQKPHFSKPHTNSTNHKPFRVKTRKSDPCRKNPPNCKNVAASGGSSKVPRFFFSKKRSQVRRRCTLANSRLNHSEIGPYSKPRKYTKSQDLSNWQVNQVHLIQKFRATALVIQMADEQVS